MVNLQPCVPLRSLLTRPVLLTARQIHGKTLRPQPPSVRRFVVRLLTRRVKKNIYKRDIAGAVTSLKQIQPTTKNVLYIYIKHWDFHKGFFALCFSTFFESLPSPSLLHNIRYTQYRCSARRITTISPSKCVKDWRVRNGKSSRKRSNSIE